MEGSLPISVKITTARNTFDPIVTILGFCPTDVLSSMGKDTLFIAVLFVKSTKILEKFKCLSIMTKISYDTFI